MPAVKVLARGWILEVDTDALLETPLGTPVWVAINGLNSLTFSNSKNDAETTTFDDEGWETHMVASRGRELSVEGFYLVDPIDGTRDMGQETVEQVGDEIGPASLASFRLTSPASKVKTFVSSVNVGDIGGGNDDPTSWGAELTISGKVTSVII